MGGFVTALLLAFAGGLALGLLFFVGLFLTVRQIGRRANGARALVWAMASLVGRLTVVLFGLWWIGSGDWRRIMTAIAGLLLARVLTVFWVRRKSGVARRIDGAAKWA